jgi:predicted metal-dependent hydrolase
MQLEPLQVRRPGYAFPDDIPRHWFGGSIFLTHLHNAFTLIFPEGERFLVRVIARAAAEQGDEALRGCVRTFLAQEAQHATEHQRFLRNLRLQGYAIDRFGELLRRSLSGLEQRLGSRSLVALVAGIEHFATVLGDFTLRHDTLDRAHPAMAALFAWHAAEEIEHRAFAHEVGRSIGVGYVRRQLALFAGAAFLAFFFTLGMAGLIRSEPKVRFMAVARDAFGLMVGDGLLVHLVKASLDYLRPGFDPRKTSDEAIAARARRWAVVDVLETRASAA